MEEARKPKRKPRKRHGTSCEDSNKKGLECSWKLDLDFEPTPDMIATDDEVRRLWVCLVGGVTYVNCSIFKLLIF